MEDDKIIQLFWNRSEAAVAEIKMKYGRLCRYIAMNILSNNEDVEECISDTFLAAWNSIPPQRPNSLSAYISSIARNLSLKKCEYNSADKRNPETTVSLSELEDCISGKDMIETLFESTMIEKAISNFLRTLDYESRNLFVRRYWYFDSIAEIARRFGMSTPKVASMLFRVRGKLKKYLVKEGISI